MKAGFSRYAPSRQDDGPPREVKPTACCAHGCPLPGVYRLSNEASICCAHDGTDAVNWAAITTRVRHRLSLWDFALRMSNAPSGTLVTSAIETAAMGLGAPEFDRAGQQTARTYARQLRTFLLRECRIERDRHRAEVPAADSWMPVGEHV